MLDATYDPFKGVVLYVRVVDGRLDGRSGLRLIQQGRRFEPLEVGCFRPQLQPVGSLETGQVGYVATGLKGIAEARVGDTVTTAVRGAEEPLPGYAPAKSMVFAGLYPSDANQYPQLREALEKLSLNDASLAWQPESSAALGFGFRCGFLGLLHMEIVQERLEREFGLDLVATAPGVEYQVTLSDGAESMIDSPARLPPPHHVSEIREPWVRVAVTMPARYVGAVMGLMEEHRGEFSKLDYLDVGGDVEEGDARVLAEYQLPLAEILVDFYDQLKSRTSGYASLDYQFASYRPARVVRLDVLVNGEPVDALSSIVPSGDAAPAGEAHGRPPEGADPAAALRRADPGGRRRAHRRPRDGARAPQERAREVLRRRRDPQAEASRGAEGGEEADEDARLRRGSAGGLHGGAAPPGLSGSRRAPDPAAAAAGRAGRMAALSPRRSTDTVSP